MTKKFIRHVASALGASPLPPPAANALHGIASSTS
jgi:hypothetical protein